MCSEFEAVFVFISVCAKAHTKNVICKATPFVSTCVRYIFTTKIDGTCWDLNPQPSVYQSNALTN
jgi:hypothetical protein